MERVELEAEMVLMISACFGACQKPITTHAAMKTFLDYSDLEELGRMIEERYHRSLHPDELGENSVYMISCWLELVSIRG